MKRYKSLFKESGSSIKFDKWTLMSDNYSVTLGRFSGKTFPAITYSFNDKKIYARDDNGKNVSKTYETKDISVKGLKSLLKHISDPIPSDEAIEKFFKMIK